MREVGERIVSTNSGSFPDKKDRVRTRCECPINGVENPRQESFLKLRVANDRSTEQLRFSLPNFPSLYIPKVFSFEQSQKKTVATERRGREGLKKKVEGAL
jgi:hypothetical protein